RIRGRFTKYNFLPTSWGPANADYRPGILFKGEEVPHVFIFGEFSKDEMGRWEGKYIAVSGVFHIEEPLAPGAPEHASKRSGSWLLKQHDWEETTDW
ncbi:MAG: hypothetical protein AAF570_18850, partial [Bacteroidota bacterium]